MNQVAIVIAVAVAAFLMIGPAGCNAGPMEWAPEGGQLAMVVGAPATPVKAPEAAPPTPAAPPQAEAPEAPQKARKARVCGPRSRTPGKAPRTMRCDGSGELANPTCSPCKVKGARTARTARK